MRPGKGEVIYDHAIPFVYLETELLHLDDVRPKSVEPILERTCITAMVTKEENKLLNNSFSKQMPPGWDGLDPLARYKALGIEIEENELYAGPRT